MNTKILKCDFQNEINILTSIAASVCLGSVDPKVNFQKK
jgi:hypothetical protein